MARILAGETMGNNGDMAFPCDHIPEDPAQFKLLGLVRQRQEERWMQRVAVPGGVLTPAQWQTLGRIAGDLTPQTPLHLTTRQDIELHNLTAEQVPLVQGQLARVALTGLGAGGDSLRNITVCPCSGILKGTVDLHPVAKQVKQTLEAEEGILLLPRKFKISFSCSPACGQPWINDLSFVVRYNRGQYGFRLIGAGSLGARPGTGMILFDWLPAENALSAAVAAVRFFSTHGDREHRNRSRLRHVRERLGDDTFLALFLKEVETTKSERAWPQLILRKPNKGFISHLTLTFPNGDITTETAEALAQITAREDLRVRISYHHQVVVFGCDEKQLREAVLGSPLATFAASGATIVSCPGTRWCKQAMVDTNRIARLIFDELGARLPPHTTVCISGCPNSCAHSAVADIGLVGQLVSRDGHKSEAFGLLMGGGMGQNDKLAKLVASKLSADEVLAKIRGIS